MINWSPGRTGRRNFTLSALMKNAVFPAPAVLRIMTIPAACAIASSWRTPGITGLSGKCPMKYGSLMVTFFTATSSSLPMNSSTRSTITNG